MARSWFSADTVKVRDDGQEEERGPSTKDEKGTDVPGPILKAFRGAWPDGAYVILKAKLTGGDFEKARRLQFDPTVSGNETGKFDVTGEVKVMLPQLIWTTIALRGFEGDVWNDDRTGKPMEVPDDLLQRLEVCRDIPFPALAWIDNKIAEMLSDPLPGQKTARSSEGESTLPSTPDSGTSQLKTSRRG